MVELFLVPLCVVFREVTCHKVVLLHHDATGAIIGWDGGHKSMGKYVASAS